MLIEKNVPLQSCNSFGVVAKAYRLVRIASQVDLETLVADPEWAEQPKFVLGGGSNICSPAISSRWF